MYRSPYGEDDRAPLTNAIIRRVLKRRATGTLLAGLLGTPTLVLVAYLMQLSLSSFSDYPIYYWMFWGLRIVFAITALGLLVSSLWKSIRYLRAAGNRFFVTADTLQQKREEFTDMPLPRWLSFVSRFYRLFSAYPDAHCYIFSGGRYRVKREALHFTFNRDLAMKETTLFRHSEVGDKFWLLSLKPGKPVEIYPEKRFRYTDSSPL